jgi:hypothetical protein
MKIPQKIIEQIKKDKQTFENTPSKKTPPSKAT